MRFSFVQNNSAAIEAELERGELDLVFVAVPPSRSGLDWLRVFDQEFVLIVPPTHRLARRRQVALRASLLASPPPCSGSTPSAGGCGGNSRILARH